MGKLLLIAFFSSCGLVYQHYVSLKTTVNKEYYRNVLKKLWSYISWKRPKLKESRYCMTTLHNSIGCTLLMTTLHPKASSSLYSPDFVPCDFCLFSLLKRAPHTWGLQQMLRLGLLSEDPQGNSFGGVYTDVKVAGMYVLVHPAEWEIFWESVDRRWKC